LPEYPYSDSFVKWLEDIGMRLSGIQSQFGSIKAMTEHKGWEKRQTIYVGILLAALVAQMEQILGELE
jgi:hypothetical protein